MRHLGAYLSLIILNYPYLNLHFVMIFKQGHQRDVSSDPSNNSQSI